jgi:hypothetical protein
VNCLVAKDAVILSTIANAYAHIAAKAPVVTVARVTAEQQAVRKTSTFRLLYNSVVKKLNGK